MTVSITDALLGEGVAENSVRPPLKIELTLGFVVDAYHADRYVCAFDALADHGDTCFHTSVATLRKRGIEFDQRDKPHVHRHGGHARYQDYRLALGSVERAERMLNRYRAGRFERKQRDSA